MDKKYIPIKGGFPRIKIPNMVLSEKKEKGFANVYSIKNMIKNKKIKPLIIPVEEDTVNIVGGSYCKTCNDICGGANGNCNKSCNGKCGKDNCNKCNISNNKTINGIPLKMIIGN